MNTETCVLVLSFTFVRRRHIFYSFYTCFKDLMRLFSILNKIIHSRKQICITATLTTFPLFSYLFTCRSLLYILVTYSCTTLDCPMRNEHMLYSTYLSDTIFTPDLCPAVAFRMQSSSSQIAIIHF